MQPPIAVNMLHAKIARWLPGTVPGIVDYTVQSIFHRYFVFWLCNLVQARSGGGLLVRLSGIRSAVGILLFFYFGRHFNHSPDCFSTRRDVDLLAAPVVYHPQKGLRDTHLKRPILNASRG